MAANKVLMQPGDIIEIFVVGDQNTASVELMGREIGVLLSQLRAQGKPALVLDNILDIGYVNAAGRNMVIELGKRLDYDRLAMLSKGGLITAGINFIMMATGRGNKIRSFLDREAAIAWLKT